MIKLHLVAPRPPRTDAEAVADAQWVAMLCDDTRFQRLIEGMGDACILEWSEGKTLEARERAYTKLQGLRLIESELQKVVDQGVRAAKVGRQKD